MHVIRSIVNTMSAMTASVCYGMLFLLVAWLAIGQDSTRLYYSAQSLMSELVITHIIISPFFKTIVKPKSKVQKWVYLVAIIIVEASIAIMMYFVSGVLLRAAYPTGNDHQIASGFFLHAAFVFLMSEISFAVDRQQAASSHAFLVLISSYLMQFIWMGQVIKYTSFDMKVVGFSGNTFYVVATIALSLASGSRFQHCIYKTDVNWLRLVLTFIISSIVIGASVGISIGLYNQLDVQRLFSGALQIATFSLYAAQLFQTHIQSSAQSAKRFGALVRCLTSFVVISSLTALHVLVYHFAISKLVLSTIFKAPLVAGYADTGVFWAVGCFAISSAADTVWRLSKHFVAENGAEKDEIQMDKNFTVAAGGEQTAETATARVMVSAQEPVIALEEEEVRVSILEAVSGQDARVDVAVSGGVSGGGEYALPVVEEEAV